MSVPSPEPTHTHAPDPAQRVTVDASLDVSQQPTATAAPDPEGTQSHGNAGIAAAPVEAIPGYELLEELDAAAWRSFTRRGT